MDRRIDDVDSMIVPPPLPIAKNRVVIQGPLRPFYIWYIVNRFEALLKDRFQFPHFTLVSVNVLVGPGGLVALITEKTRWNSWLWAELSSHTHIIVSMAKLIGIGSA